MNKTTPRCRHARNFFPLLVSCTCLSPLNSCWVIVDPQFVAAFSAPEHSVEGRSTGHYPPNHSVGGLVGPRKHQQNPPTTKWEGPFVLKPKAPPTTKWKGGLTGRPTDTPLTTLWKGGQVSDRKTTVLSCHSLRRRGQRPSRLNQSHAEGLTTHNALGLTTGMLHAQPCSMCLHNNAASTAMPACTTMQHAQPCRVHNHAGMHCHAASIAMPACTTMQQVHPCSEHMYNHACMDHHAACTAMPACTAMQQAQPCLHAQPCQHGCITMQRAQRGLRAQPCNTYSHACGHIHATCTAMPASTLMPCSVPEKVFIPHMYGRRENDQRQVVRENRQPKHGSTCNKGVKAMPARAATHVQHAHQCNMHNHTCMHTLAACTTTPTCTSMQHAQPGLHAQPCSTHSHAAAPAYVGWAAPAQLVDVRSMIEGLRGSTLKMFTLRSRRLSAG